MKLSDDEHEQTLKKEKKKKKRTHAEIGKLEELDDERINAELLKLGVNPDELKIDEEELP